MINEILKRRIEAAIGLNLPIKNAVHETQQRFLLTVGAKLAMQWISVDDALPPLCSNVLTWHNGKMSFIVADWNGGNWADDQLNHISVTHWMPLPPTPGE